MNSESTTSIEGGDEPARTKCDFVEILQVPQDFKIFATILRGARAAEGLDSRPLAGVLQAGCHAVNRKQKKSFQRSGLLLIIAGEYSDERAKLDESKPLDARRTARHRRREHGMS